jgi:hypothetical protein
MSFDRLGDRARRGGQALDERERATGLGKVEPRSDVARVAKRAAALLKRGSCFSAMTTRTSKASRRSKGPTSAAAASMIVMSRVRSARLNRE